MSSSSHHDLSPVSDREYPYLQEVISGEQEQPPPGDIILDKQFSVDGNICASRVAKRVKPVSNFSFCPAIHVMKLASLKRKQKSLSLVSTSVFNDDPVPTLVLSMQHEKQGMDQGTGKTMHVGQPGTIRMNIMCTQALFNTRYSLVLITTYHTIAMGIWEFISYDCVEGDIHCIDST